MPRAQADEICYVQLTHQRVPVLVTPQPDGSIWIGGAYLDTIAREHRLIPRPLPHEMEEKTKEWLQAIGDRWQIPGRSLTPRPSGLLFPPRSPRLKSLQVKGLVLWPHDIDCSAEPLGKVDRIAHPHLIGFT